MMKEKNKISKMKIFKIFTVMSIVCCITFLSSCSFKSLTPSELLKPPTSADKINEIKKNIKLAIPEETFPIIPISGQFRNSLNFFDINNDTTDELIYIYSLSQDKSNPNICVFNYNNGKYEKNYTISAIALGIDFISFTDYNFDNASEITVGYLQTNSEQKQLSIYDVKSNEPKEILNTAYNIESVIAKPDNSKYLFIASLTAKDAPAKGRLYEYTKNKFDIISECNMNGSISSYASVLTDTFNDQTRIVVNENIDAITISSEIIGISSDKKLINYSFVDGKSVFSEQLTRVSNIYAQDIDKDGIIEFPTSVEKVNRIQNLQPSVNISCFSTFNNEKFSAKMYLVLNPAERYYLIFKEEWLPMVTVKTDITSSNYSFYYKTQTDNEELLFSILSLSPEDWEEKKVDENYQLIKQLPDRIYVAFLPKTNVEIAKEFQPSIDDLKKAFVGTTIKQR